MNLAVFTVLVVMAAAWLIYSRTTNRMTKLKHFREKASKYELRRKYEKAIAVRQEALVKFNDLSDLDKGDLLLGIGGCYLSMNNCAKATEYFDRAFASAANTQYPYNKDYRKVVQAYVDCGRREDAIRILDELISRQSYDKRFKRFEDLKTSLVVS